MKLLLILLLAVDHEVSRASTVSPIVEVTKIKRIISLKQTGNTNESTDNKPVIEKPDANLSHDVRESHHHYNPSEEVYEKPKRERETDEDFLKKMIKEILSYEKLKHLLLRHSNVSKKRLHHGIVVSYDDNETNNDPDDAKVSGDSSSEDLTYVKLRSFLPRPRKRPKKISQKHYVPERHPRVAKRADEGDNTYTTHSYKDILIELLNILRYEDKNNEEVKERLSTMAMTLTKYLQQFNRNENYVSGLKGRLESNKADLAKKEIDDVSKDLVNRIILEIKLLLSTHKGKSKLYVSRILDIFTNNQEFLIFNSDQACRKTKTEFLIHAINTVYQRYLTNAECEGEYLDIDLDVIDWRSSNPKHNQLWREFAPNHEENDSSGEPRSLNSSKIDRILGYSDESSGELRLFNSFEDKRNSKTNKLKRSLTRGGVQLNTNDEATSDDITNKKEKLLSSGELESDEDNRDPNREILDKYTKSRLFQTSGSLLVNKPDPYFSEIEKLFIKQDGTNTALDSIRQVCEKIASVQFLHTVEAIAWRLLQSTDCKPENTLKSVIQKKIIDPITMKMSKSQREPKSINSFSLEDASEDTLDLNDYTNLSNEKNIKYTTRTDNGEKTSEKSNSKSEAMIIKLEKFYIPAYKISLGRKLQRFQDITRVRNGLQRIKSQNIFGSGKINSLKVIKQKLKDLNVTEYKKLINNIPVVEKLLKIIYNKLPPELQTVFNVLKPSVIKIMDNGSFSVKNLPTLIIETYMKGKGKDLLEMMANKFKHKKMKKPVKLIKDNHGKTKLMKILRKVSELHLPAENKTNHTNLLVVQEVLQATTETHKRLHQLPQLELPSSVEKNDKPVVELTYVFNNPPVIFYKPKFLVKHNISYDQYLKNIKNIYNNDSLSIGNQIQLIKVVKNEGDVSQVVYEADIPKGPVEINSKSAILKLFKQLYNLNESIENDASSVEKNNENDNTKRIKASNSIEAAGKEKTKPTYIAPMVTATTYGKSTELESRNIELELNFKDTANNISKDKEFALQPNETSVEDFEEFFLNDARSEEVDTNMTTQKPPLRSGVHIDREGKILWNNYPIHKPQKGRRKSLNRKWVNVARLKN